MSKYVRDETHCKHELRATTLWSGSQYLKSGAIALNENVFGEYNRLVIYYVTSTIIGTGSKDVYKSIEIPVEKGIVFNLDGMMTGASYDTNDAVSTFKYIYTYINATLTDTNVIQMCEVERGKAAVYGTVFITTDEGTYYQDACGIIIKKVVGYNY